MASCREEFPTSDTEACCPSEGDDTKKKKESMRLIGSTRIGIFIIFVLATYNYMLQRLVINFSLVCMIKDPVHFKDDLESLDFQNGSYPSLHLVNESYDDAVVVPCELSDKTDVRLSEGEFDWDKEVQGIILASFYYGLVIFMLLGGWICDRAKVSRIFVICGGIHGLITIINPLFARWGPYYLVGVRFFQGILQGVSIPGINVLTSRWCGSSERGFLVSIAYAGFSLAAATTYPITAFACENFGWEYAFVLAGMTGIVWSVLAYFFLYDWPERHPRISKKELDFISSNREVQYKIKGVTKKPKVPWLRMLTSAPVISVMISNLCCMWNFYVCVTYLPSFLKEAFHADISENGIFSALPFAVMLVFHFKTAALFDYLRGKKLMKLIYLRKIFNSIGTIIPSVALCCLEFLPRQTNPCDSSLMIPAVLLIATAQAFSEYAFMGGYLLSLFELAPRFAGVLTGIMNSSGLAAGFLSPIIVAHLTPEVESPKVEWMRVMYISAGLNLFGSLVYLVFGEAKECPWAAEQIQVKSTASETRKKHGSELLLETDEDSGHSNNTSPQSTVTNPSKENPLAQRDLRSLENII